MRTREGRATGWVGLGLHLLLCGVVAGCGRGLADKSMRARGEVVLTQFLQDLHDGRYLEAAGVYGGDYQALWEWNPGIPPDDRVSLLRSGCTNNGLQCYPVGRIVAVVHADPDEVVFLVELAVDADSTLVTGPCCGEGGPAESQFRFTVRRVGGRVVVMSLPPYAA